MAEVQEVEAGRGHQLRVALKGETLGLCVLVVGLLPQGVSGPGPGLVMLRASSEATGGGLFPCCAGPGCVPVAVAPSLTSDLAHWAPSICPSIWMAVSDLLTALGSSPDCVFCAPVAWRTLRWRGRPSVPSLSVLPGRGLESVSWRLMRHQLPCQHGWSLRANVRFQHEHSTPANGSAAAAECELVLKVKG